MIVCVNLNFILNQKILRHDGGFFDDFKLHTEGLDDCIAEEPAASDDRAAAAKQNYNYNTDNERCIVFLGLLFSWGNRHFIHDSFSFFFCMNIVQQ